MKPKLWQAMCIAVVAVTIFLCIARIDAQSFGPGRNIIVAFSQSISVDGATLQIDFAEGALDLPRSEVIQRIQQAAHVVAIYYGHFPVARLRILVLPVTDRHGILQGTTWGNIGGFPAFLRLRLGQSTTHDELFNDWIIIHELAHTALPDLPDDQHWLEEGLASYVEPIARVQAGDMDVKSMWAGLVRGMPNGEPGPGDRGLNNTHTWGRTYWGGALFCLVADVEIRRQTSDRKGLQDALRGIVAAGGTIDKDWPVDRILRIGDEATGTRILEEMYSKWGETPVTIDLPALWQELGVKVDHGNVMFDPAAPRAAIRGGIASPKSSEIR